MLKRILTRIEPGNERDVAERLFAWLNAQDNEDTPVKGGRGSGYFAPHYGLPGQRGGSAPRQTKYEDELPKLRQQWDDADEHLLHKVIAEFGFTYHPLDGTSPTAGFALSPYRDRERILDVKTLTADDLEQYLIDNEDIWSRPDHYFGAWYNTEDGKVYLDVSIVVSEPAEAERLSAKHKQEAYYDIEKGETVYVRARGDDGKSLSLETEKELLRLVELYR